MLSCGARDRGGPGEARSARPVKWRTVAGGLGSDDVVLALVRLVGPTSTSRGQSYATAGAVSKAVWDAEGTRLSAVVHESGAGPCKVDVEVTPGTAGRIARVEGTCSCPRARNCKHVAAALIFAPPPVENPSSTLARLGLVAPIQNSTQGSAGRAAAARRARVAADLGGAPGGRSASSAASVKRRPASWREPLESLLSRDTPPAAAPRSRRPGVADRDPDPLGLQFELVASRPLAARGSAKGSERVQRPGVRLRPVTRSSTGNWVRNNVTWNSLEYLVGWRASWGATSYNPEHISLLRELRALARLYDNRRWVSSGDEAVWLESIGSRRLWDLLRQATEIGLHLVAAGRSAAAVTLSPEAAAAELDASLDSASLKITPRLVHAGQLLPSENLLLAGDPPHGLVYWGEPPLTTRTPALVLAPLSSQLSTPAADLIRTAGTIEVPAKQVGMFEAELLPQLRRRLAVTSSDASYAPPPTPADVVVCCVTHNPGPSVELAWSLEQGGTHRPVDDEPDEKAASALADAAELLSGLAELTVATSTGLNPTAGRLDGVDAARFVADTLPELAAIDGIRVDQVGEAPGYREVPEGPTLRIGGERATDGDWLDLAVEVTVEGEKVAFEQLFVALAEGASHMFLPSGAWFSLERDDLRRLAELISEARALHDAPSGGVRLSRYQSSIWEDLSAIVPVEGDITGWADGLRALASPAPPPRVPKSLKAQLRPYQMDGFAWLATRYAQRVGGILADDMGLGKTLQALALICHARESRQDAKGPSESLEPFLVVAPTSVVSTWASEAARFAPDLRVVTVTQTTAKSRVPMPELVGDAGLVVTSYALFRLDFDRYEALSWAGLLLDEAQFVKNPASHAYQRARRLSTPWKLAMTGTPLENSLSELWALTSITAPGLFGRLDKFSAAYKVPIERNSDEAKLEALRRRIKPIMLRRTKSQVLPDLPDKQEQVLAIELDARHRRIYDTWLARERQKVLGLLGDLEANRFEIFRSLTLLRQAALDVSLVDPSHNTVPSAKLDMLSETLSEAVAEGHRALVFSQFTRFLRSAQRRLESDGIATCYLDGRTKKRAQVIDDFRSGKAAVFLISLKAGGFGLNLTEADHCILLDPWWNPATEAQAVDRVHRIGQTRKVIVYRYVASGTIEEKVMALKARKAELFAGVMDSGGFESAALSASDIEVLLS